MAVVFEDIHSSADTLRQFYIPRAFSARLIELIEKEGIFSIIREMGRFTRQEFCDVLEKQLGYRTGGAARKRMLLVMLDFLEECGHIFQTMPDIYTYRSKTKPEELLSHSKIEIMKETFEGQYEFFNNCIDYAGDFLRGGDYLYSFQEGMEDVWDRFLGNHEFSVARNFLLKTMTVNKTPDCRIMDLCYGTGHGLKVMCEEFSDADITAVDFTGAMKPFAMQKLRCNAVRIRWVDEGAWGGFGCNLPFETMTFSSIFFSCCDPYIPKTLRDNVYRDIFRVLKPNGILGVVAWGYPDKARLHIQNQWVRRGIYIHDFAESVCKGWQGFSDIDCTIRMAKNIGFVEGNPFFNNFYMLDSAVWMFKKP